jgi:drug/metabolite transporter (DMT)-like permease
LLLVSAFSIATSSVLARRAYDFGSSPETITVIRVAVPALVFGTWFAVIGWRSGAVTRLGWRVLALMVAYGLTLLIINMFELKALERVPVAVVVLVVALVPLWISLISWLLWRVPLGLRGGLAVAAALGGTALVVGAPGGEIDLLGLAFSFATSVLSAGLYLLVERGLHRVSPPAIIAVGALAATAVAVSVEPGALPDELGGGGHRTALALGAGLGVTVTMILTLVAIRHSSAFVAGVAVACEPIFAGLLAWWILGERLSGFQLLGGAVALTGLVLALTQFANSPPQPISVGGDERAEDAVPVHER